MTTVRKFVAALFAALLVALPISAEADFGAPKKKVDCTKPENKNKAACKPSAGEASDDEIFNAAYWMAREGQYTEALRVLALAANKDDPRILNATGFATRKLGRVEAALPYYQKALSIDPNYVLAREYLGEAYLSKGDLDSARVQLSEIESRCGVGCTAYVNLARHISDFVGQSG
ncbi:MAG: tetratricopeptide repeat protein [Hyphomicrobium sp.]|nr:tetratricopeptide repeat protein [Hyphomicrobium sp.]